MINDETLKEIERYYENNPEKLEAKTMHDEDLKELDKKIKELKDKGVIVSD